MQTITDAANSKTITTSDSDDTTKTVLGIIAVVVTQNAENYRRNFKTTERFLERGVKSMMEHFTDQIVLKIGKGRPFGKMVRLCNWKKYQ